jgi:hypothetical protein
MSEQDLLNLLNRSDVATWRQRLARWVESNVIQRFIIMVILLNGLILGLETSPAIMERASGRCAALARPALSFGLPAGNLS